LDRRGFDLAVEALRVGGASLAVVPVLLVAGDAGEEVARRGLVLELVAGVDQTLGGAVGVR
jgi:hypothetical protein